MWKHKQLCNSQLCHKYLCQKLLKSFNFFQAMIANIGDVFFTFLYILMHISLGLLSLSSSEAGIG